MVARRGNVQNDEFGSTLDVVNPRKSSGMSSIAPIYGLQTRVPNRLVARRKHGLQPETNAQQGYAACDGVAERLHKRTLGERAHQRSEMADARKNQRVARRKRVRRGRAARFDAEPCERALDRWKISCAIFNQCDVHSSPFVLGRMCFNCGSRVAANRNAR